MGETLRNKIYDFLSKRVVYHTLFWLGTLAVLLAIDSSKTNFLGVISIEIVNLIFYAMVVYFNLLYLIPNYLSKKAFVNYAFFLLLTALTVTPLKMLTLHLMFTGNEPLRAQLINDQTIYFLSSFIIAGGSTVLKIFSDWVRYQRDRQILEKQNMQSELRFLKSQINPHFLFNTLNSLYALTLKKSEKAPEIVVKLSEMMRYMLYECNEKSVPLSKEVNYIQNYLELEKLRHGNHVDIKFDLEGKVDNQVIAPLMFIPFLENSFKHGLKNQIQEGFVDIHLKVEEQQVTVNIENSKAQTLPTQIHKRSGGIGLKNVQRRLNILYPNKHNLSITETPKTYSIQLQIGLV